MSLWKLRLTMLRTLTAIIGLSELFFTIPLSLLGVFNILTLGLIVVLLDVVQWLITPYNIVKRLKASQKLAQKNFLLEAFSNSWRIRYVYIKSQSRMPKLPKQV